MSEMVQRVGRGAEVTARDHLDEARANIREAQRLNRQSTRIIIVAAVLTSVNLALTLWICLK